LLDASAIITVAKRLGDRARRILKGNATLVLAFYEIGNFVWKEHRLVRRAELHEALRAAADFADVLKLMDVIYPDPQADLPGTCELAARTGLTFYDASYLYVALREGLTLVTEDSELAEKAGELGVSVMTVEELIGEAGPSRRPSRPGGREGEDRQEHGRRGCGQADDVELAEEGHGHYEHEDARSTAIMESPGTRPRIMAVLEAGATVTSFRNALNQHEERPEGDHGN